MKPTLIIILFALIPILDGAIKKDAYVLESRELVRRHQIQEIYSDTLIRTSSGVWDLDTDTQLAEIDQGADFGSFLDFDPNSKRSLYRQRYYDSARGKYFFVIEARDQEGKLLFSKEDKVSNEPEAFFVSDGQFLLKRTNNPDTFELILELYRIESGELIWRHIPGGSPRWRLSADSLSFLELASERSENSFHTAIAYDTLTQTEVDRCDLRGLKISRQSDYLSRFNSPVAVVRGSDGTFLYHQTSQSLSALRNSSWGLAPSSNSPKLSADTNTILLQNFNSLRGELAWAVFDARNGERIATSDQLQTEAYPFLRNPDPALSPSGELVYQVVENGKIDVWNLLTKSLVRELSYTNVPFETLVPSADDRYVLALALSGANDDFMVLIDTQTNLPVYSKIKRDPDIFFPPSNSGGYVVGFTRSLYLPPSGDRFFFSTVQGLEAFDYLTGQKVEDGAAFVGKAISTRYVASEQSWVTVYETGRVKIESDTPSIPIRWIQLPNTTGVRYAAIDSQSGSVAFQRDRAFFITHPFDEREDQWIADLSLGIYPISLHRGGKWLAAHFRGIYDLETEAWLPLESNFYSLYAIDLDSKRCALYDNSLDAIVVRDLEANTRIEIPFEGRFSMIRALEFNADRDQLYLLVHPANGTFNEQSVCVVDLESRTIVQQIELGDTIDTYPYTQMHVHPTEEKVVLGRRNGTIKSVNLNTAQISLPAIPEPIYSAEWDNGEFDLSAPKTDSSIRFVDEYGNLYHLRATTAQEIPSKLLPSSDSASELTFAKDTERTYWIQTSADLKNWSTHPNAQSVGTWFQNKDAGFFRVFESEEETQIQRVNSEIRN